MAVVQISRIQVRRGQENTGSGLPQLAGGEFGWATDTQKLYIGNGSVTEGAPAVGNSEILTEHSNILDILELYQYKQGDIQTREGTPVARTVSARLDDRVSLRAFGARGDGDDITDVLQKALYELYLRQDREADPQSRVTLYVEAGEYVISDTVNVPPYATIVGEGKDKTIFKKQGDFVMFDTVSSESLYTGILADAIPVTEPVLQGSEQARNITISLCTLQNVTNESTLLQLNSCKDSNFKDIKFLGPKTTGSAEDRAINLRSKTDLVASINNRFENCDFEGIGYGAWTDHSIQRNIWDNCSFIRMNRGFNWGENQTIGQEGARYNTITNCFFDDIDAEAIRILAGTDNRSEQNTFGFSVANDGGSAATATYPIIKFGESGNDSVDDIFNRAYSLAVDQNFVTTAPYFPEVEGVLSYDRGGSVTIDVVNNTTPLYLYRMSAETSKNYKVSYIYNSTVEGRDFTRSGELDLLINRNNNYVRIVDEYEYTGLESLDDNLKFTADLFNNNGTYACRILVENPNDSGTVTLKINSKT